MMEEAKSLKQVVEEEEQELRQAVEKFNSLLLDSETSANDLTAAEDKAKQALASYTGDREALVYSEILDTDAPVKEACRLLEYETLTIKDVREEGILMRKDVEKTSRRYDLYALCKRARGQRKDLDQAFLYRSEGLLKSIALRIAGEIDAPDSTKQDIRLNFKCSEKSEYTERISNKEILRQLTEIVHLMLGETELQVDENGKEEEVKLDPMSFDVRHLLNCSSGSSKTRLKERIVKSRAFMGLVAEICHRILVRGRWDLEYEVRK